MTRSVRSVYENGIFRPVEMLVGIPDHAEVRLGVEQDARDTGCLADFAGRWTVQDVDEIAAAIDAEFKRVTPYEW